MIRLKRTLIVVYVALSALAVFDILGAGAGGYGSVIDQTFGPIVRSDGAMGREPDYVASRTPMPVEVEKGDWMTMEGLQGSLEIVSEPSATGRATLDYVVEVWGSGDLKAFADRVALELERRDGEILVRLARPVALPAGVTTFRVRAALRMPSGVNVRANHTGQLLIDGIEGEVHVLHTAGDAEVRRVNGPVTVTSRFSRMNLNWIEGDVRAVHQGGSLGIHEIRGSLTGEMRFGEVRVDGVTQDVDFTVDQGAGEFAGIGGNVGLDIRMGGAVLRGLVGDGDLSVRFGDLTVYLGDGAGWTVEGVAEMGEFQTNTAVAVNESRPRSEISGVIGDGSGRLVLDVRQGSATVLGPR